MIIMTNALHPGRQGKKIVMRSAVSGKIFRKCLSLERSFRIIRGLCILSDFFFKVLVGQLIVLAMVLVDCCTIFCIISARKALIFLSNFLNGASHH
jgi:hypothetical protein